jgi:tRNA threonylcarbamoyl adenosine modification protein YeaZ
MPTHPCLYLDTTSHVMHMAIAGADGAWVVRQNTHTSQRYHSAVIFPELQALLADAGVSAQDLKALVVNRGPGSFTGIRTGLTVVRVLAQFGPNLDPSQVYGVTTFDVIAAAMAEQHPGQSVSIWLDALRGQAYHAVLCWQAGQIVTHQPAALVSVEQLHQQLAQANGHQNTNQVVVVSSSALLPEALEADAPVVVLNETPLLNVPRLMQTLVAAQPQDFALGWEALLPLYLQDPNITVKRSPVAGTVSAAC